jgi:hypothetical protein
MRRCIDFDVSGTLLTVAIMIVVLLTWLVSK